MVVTYLTKEWYEKLLEELRLLKDEKLPQILQRLKEAISQWDISENAEYDTAMSDKDLLEARISEIETTLENVEIIASGARWGNEVRYGSLVTIRDDKDKEAKLTIVGGGEVDILKGTISFESPLGIALRWKKKWDVVQVRAPSRKYNVTIVDIK